MRSPQRTPGRSSLVPSTSPTRPSSGTRSTSIGCMVDRDLDAVVVEGDADAVRSMLASLPRAAGAPRRPPTTRAEVGRSIAAMSFPREAERRPVEVQRRADTSRSSSRRASSELKTKTSSSAPLTPVSAEVARSSTGRTRPAASTAPRRRSRSRSRCRRPSRRSTWRTCRSSSGRARRREDEQVVRSGRRRLARSPSRRWTERSSRSRAARRRRRPRPTS